MGPGSRLPYVQYCTRALVLFVLYCIMYSTALLREHLNAGYCNYDSISRPFQSLGHSSPLIHSKPHAGTLVSIENRHSYFILVGKRTVLVRLAVLYGTRRGKHTVPYSYRFVAGRETVRGVASRATNRQRATNHGWSIKAIEETSRLQ